jgi:hypothetical protein
VYGYDARQGPAGKALERRRAALVHVGMNQT